MSLLLDTHIWLWFAEDARQLKPRSKALLEKTPYSRMKVSAVSVWEIVMLVHYGRLKLAQSPRVFVENSLKTGIQIIDLTADISLESYVLPGDFHKDPADRMIIATARQHGLTLVTQDKAILAYAKRGYVKAT